MLWQVASHWISGKGPPAEGTVGVKVLRWQAVTKLEEEQEDQSGWGNPPTYELGEDEIRGKRGPGRTDI